MTRHLTMDVCDYVEPYNCFRPPSLREAKKGTLTHGGLNYSR